MIENSASEYHTPVMPAETLAYLDPKPGETHLDATLGGGGHSALIVPRIAPNGTLIGFDRDAEALQAAQQRFAESQAHDNIILIRTAFGKLEDALTANSSTTRTKLDGALFDLGVSSHQLDAERGFSFRRDEPLDMRMDNTAGTTAAELLAQADEAEIARILWEYGDERFSRKIARNIILCRQEQGAVTTTRQLAELVERSIPRAAHPKDIHAATRTFQAIRIAVNDELGQLQAGLNAAIGRLAPGGRIVVIAYHSLEDRIVKQTFQEAAGRRTSAPGSSPAAFLPSATAEPTLTLLTRKPVVPTDTEIAQNPRARSAKLRAAVKRE